MHIWLFILTAVVSYLITGINPAIVLSKKIYHQDIRNCGSGNPGFTNFKRTFGGKTAWLVFTLDLLKGILLWIVFGYLFETLLGSRQLGVAYSLFFAMLGHAYPVWYRFKGGKGFLVCMSAVWFLDWRAGLVATIILALLLFTTKYMSLSTMLAMASAPVVMLITKADMAAVILCAISVLFMVLRHRKNIVRLAHGTESKFSFHSSGETQAAQ